MSGEREESAERPESPAGRAGSGEQVRSTRATPLIRAFVLPTGVDAVEVARIEQTEGPDLESPVLDEAAIRDLFGRLRDAGRRIRSRSVAERVEALGSAGERFLDPDGRWAREAVPLMAANSRFSESAASEVLAGMAADWTRSRLSALVESEFPGGGLDRGEGAVRTDPAGSEVSRMVSVPEVVTTICSGTVPGVSTTAAIRSLLVGAGTLLKPGAGDVVLPTLFARVLRDIAPDLADALAVVYWRGGDAVLEDEALTRSDRIVVYGGDETVRSVRARASTGATLLEYRHRVGVAVVGTTAGNPGEKRLDGVARRMADAVVPYEQRGCVSPSRVYAIGSRDDVRALCAACADALEDRERTTPAVRTREESAAYQQLVGSLELRRAAGEDVDVWAGKGWAVTLDPAAEPFAGGRIVTVTRLETIEHLREELARYRGRLQAVGVAGLDRPHEARVARWAADAGASRIGPLERVAYPPPWWIHDGRGPLRALVDLVEWEPTAR